MAVMTARRVAALGLAVALGASACADSGDDAGDQGTTAPRPDGEPIVLANIGDFSAGVAAPEIPAAFEATIDAVNRAGGVDGRPLEAFVCDSGDDPNAAAACGRDALDAGAVAVVGSWSLLTAEWFPLMEQAQVPVVGATPFSASDFASPVSYPTWGGFIVESAGLLRGLAEDGRTRIAIARPDFAAGPAVSRFASSVLEPFGLDVVADVAVPVGAVDMAPYVQAALETGADGVVVGLLGNQNVGYVVELRGADPQVEIGLTGTDVAAVVDALGAEAEGILRAAEIAPLEADTEATQEFVEAMEDAGVAERTPIAERTYASVSLVAEVLRTSGATSGAELIEVLDATTAAPLADLAPPVDFTAGGVAGIPRMFQPCVLLVRLDAPGASEPVSGRFEDAVTGDECVQPAGFPWRDDAAR